MFDFNAVFYTYVQLHDLTNLSQENIANASYVKNKNNSPP